MELKRAWIAESPTDAGTVRLCGEVAYDDPSHAAEVYWFEVPRPLSGALTTSGNPWLVALLPLAVTLGERLRVSARTDRLLVENARELVRIWKCWYPGLSIVPIEAELDDGDGHRGAGRTAAFFSGGIDSFFTVLRPNDPRQAVQGVDDLLSVWGFDVPLENVEEFRRMREALRSGADELAKEHVAVATNIRQTRWKRTDWGGLAHNCALASVALALESRWGNVLIGSTHGYADLQPWGSHPLTDPLLSSRGTRVIHHGAAYTRVEKTAAVAQSSIALKVLRVCWRSRAEVNCGACEKCYRTMTTLWLLGALERCPTFRPGSFDRSKIGRIYCRTESDVSFLREIRALAVQMRRTEVARAIDRSIARSRRINRLLPVVSRLEGRPLVWRWASRLRRVLLAGCVA